MVERRVPLELSEGLRDASLLAARDGLLQGPGNRSVLGGVAAHVDGRLRGRGQALYAAIGYGASGVVAGVAGGALVQSLGYAAVFWAASAAGLLAALCCAKAIAAQRAAA